MRRKGKRMIKYNGIEQWITDSDEEDDRKSKRHSSKYGEYDARGKRKSHKYSSKYDNSDDDEREHRGRGKCYYSGDEYDGKKYKKNSRVRFYDDLDSDQDTRRGRKDKKRNKKWQSESESDISDDEYEERKRKGRRRRESSSEESGSDSEESLCNVRVYTTWKKDRVPYCDEYVFPCRKWLAKDEGDGQIERELKPDTVVTYYRIPADKDDKKDRRY